VRRNCDANLLRSLNSCSEHTKKYTFIITLCSDLFLTRTVPNELNLLDKGVVWELG